MKALALNPCIPPFWALEGHTQTLLGYFLPSEKVDSQSEHLQVPLDDGDQLLIELHRGTSDYLILLFHGLSGNSRSGYMQRMARIFLKEGHSVILVNHRGCGLGKGLAKNPYHSGSSKDLSQVFAYARALFPRLQQIAIGFSLSGNALLRLLTESDKVQPDRAIAVNPPVDLERASRSLRSGLNRIYDQHFVFKNWLDLSFKKRKGLLAHKIKYEFNQTLYDFDEKYTAPAAGFQSRSDYYQRCSTVHKLTQISVPTVILTSKDDPFVAWDSYMVADLSSKVCLHVEPVGGHMGYLSAHKTPLQNHRWMDYALDAYVKNWTQY